MTEPAHPEYAVAAPRVYFDAELRPYRSLSPAGFLIVMSAVAGGGFTIGLAFFLAGAWPVAGFSGLEVFLVYVAFKLNYRAARRCEVVRLTDNGLEIRRIDPAGREKTDRLEPAWLSVELDSSPKCENRLAIRSRDRFLTIGSFLPPEERVRLAEALRRALEAWRAPEHLKPDFL